MNNQELGNEALQYKHSAIKSIFDVEYDQQNANITNPNKAEKYDEFDEKQVPDEYTISANIPAIEERERMNPSDIQQQIQHHIALIHMIEEAKNNHPEIALSQEKIDELREIAYASNSLNETRIVNQQIHQIIEDYELDKNQNRMDGYSPIIKPSL